MFLILENYFKPEFYLTKAILISPKLPCRCLFACLKFAFYTVPTSNNLLTKLRILFVSLVGTIVFYS